MSQVPLISRNLRKPLKITKLIAHKKRQSKFSLYSTRTEMVQSISMNLWMLFLESSTKSERDL